MNQEKIFLKNISFDNIAFSLIGLILLVSVIIGGGTTSLSLAIITPIVLLLIYIRHRSGGQIIRLPKFITISLALFIFANIISIVYSYDKHQSVFTFIYLFLSIICGIELAGLLKEGANLHKFSKIVIIISTISILVGAYFYATTSELSGVRFVTTFLQPNSTAGFMLLPLSFLIPSFIWNKNKNKKILLGIISILTIVALILTKSRGTIVIFLSIWLFIFILSLIKKESKLQISHLLQILTLVLISSLLAFGIYSYKISNSTLTSKQDATTSAIGTDSTTEGQAIGSRLEYMRTGINIIKYNIVSGVGIGVYRQAERKYIDNPVYETIDPHNLYIRTFAETGILGGLTFFLIIFSLGIFILHKLWKKNLSEFSPLKLGLVAGTLSVILHNAIDMDWYFPANMLISILSFFALYVVLNKDIKDLNIKMKQVFRIILTIFVIIFIGISSMILLAENYSSNAIYFQNQDRFGEAYDSYKSSLAFDKYNSITLYNYSAFLLKYASILEDQKVKNFVLSESLAKINSALMIRPHNSPNYDLRADIYKELGEVDQYESNLMQATEENPILNLNPYMKLTELYLEQKRYDECIVWVDKIVATHKPSLFNDPFWQNPAKPIIKANILSLLETKKKALEKLGKKDEVKQVQSLIEEYSD